MRLGLFTLLVIVTVIDADFGLVVSAGIMFVPLIRRFSRG